MTVEELREQLQEHIVEFRAILSGDIMNDINSLIAAAREEGAELERARIRDSNPFVFTGEYYVLPAAVLAPKEESK